MLWDASALVVATTAFVVAIEASWIYWLVRIDSPRRYRKTLNDILDERFPQTKGVMKGGQDPRALVESREEKKARNLAAMFAFIQERTGSDAAPLYWNMIPDELKISLARTGNSVWAPAILKFLSNSAVKPKAPLESKNPYMGA